MRSGVGARRSWLVDRDVHAAVGGVVEVACVAALVAALTRIEWTLVLTLAVTPLRRLPRLNGLIGYRRMLGLFAFFYAVLHFTVWWWLDRGLDFGEMWADVMKRRFIAVGMLGLVVMAPLAVTSTKGWIRRLGKNWTRLHRLTYVAAVAGVVHYYWLVKSDIRGPLLYFVLVAALLGWRGYAQWRRRAA
jgi:methionine sulfoxide reductase heme-binding subunit